MANTIPGGAYQLPNKTWINAEGKPIPAPKGPIYESREEALPLEEALAPETVTPGAEDEYSAEKDLVEEEDRPRARKKKS